MELESETIEDCVELCKVGFVLGWPQKGRNAGAFADIDYTNGGGARIDIATFWHAGVEESNNLFNWRGLVSSTSYWVLTRPDV